MRPRLTLGIAGTALLLALTSCFSTTEASTPDEAVSTDTVPAAPEPAGPALGAPESIAVLGDSISRGVNACGKLGDCEDASWATGSDPEVRSHRQRIMELDPSAEPVVNLLAVNGAQAVDLPVQAAGAVDVDADYVTVQVGANDACSNSPDTPEEFRASIDATLGTLADGVPEAKIFVASIPDLYRLWEVGHTNDTALWVWGLGVCEPLLGEARSDEDRQAVRTLVREYNEQLGAACGQYPDTCRFDGGAVFDAEWELSEVSTLDYFHPGIAGQRRLAEITWPLGWAWATE